MGAKRKTPYQVGQQVWCCYEGRGRAIFWSVGTVVRVGTYSSVYAGWTGWQVMVEAPNRVGQVAYHVDEHGVDDGRVDEVGPISPTGHQWIAPYDDSLLGAGT